MNDRVLDLALELARETGVLQAYVALHEIAAHAKASSFTSAEVIAWTETQAGERLRIALTAARGESSVRQVGELLREWRGRTLGGITVERQGRDGQGACWRLCIAPDASHAGANALSSSRTMVASTAVFTDSENQ